MDSKYIAAMVLSGVGDALGYRGGSWEFNFIGEDIAKELKGLGGLRKIKVKKPDWPVSDDTVLNIANAEALIKMSKEPLDIERLFSEMAFNYKNTCSKDMVGRSPGMTTINSCHMLKPGRPKGYKIPFNSRGGGCGASMRSMCIGLRYPDITQESCLQNLITISVESSRMTHHHPTGFLGGFASALFTALAVKDVPAAQWGSTLMKLIPQVKKYIEEDGNFVKENLENCEYFMSKWDSYLSLREIKDGTSTPKFPEKYDIKERDSFYKSISHAGWGGASGHDSVIIAYDAFLAQPDSWDGLCSHGMFHGGDSDSTGVMAGCWYGAKHGFEGVYENNYINVEYHDRLTKAGSSLYKMALEDKFI